MINIDGLELGEVVAALYNASQPLGLGLLHYDPKPMTAAEGQELVDAQASNKRFIATFDYLKGRVMKVTFHSRTEFNEQLYDRDNGQGAAAAVIAELRERKESMRKALT